MSEMISLKLPLVHKDLVKLKAGDCVLLSGELYTARDAAHERGLPIDVKGQVVFYAGPILGKGGCDIECIGPTTASRMDAYLEPLLKKGLAATIGKGPRSKQSKELMQKYEAVYFVATGGAAALLSKNVAKAAVVAYPDLGAEAVLKLEVDQFPVTVAYDTKGGDLFEEGQRQFKS